MFLKSITLPASMLLSILINLTFSDTTSVLKDTTNNQILNRSDSISQKADSTVKVTQTIQQDSLLRLTIQKNLLQSINDRRSLFYNQLTQIQDPYKISLPELFQSDRTGLSEITRHNPFIVQIPSYISSVNNRFLLYGQVAPVQEIQFNSIIPYQTQDRFLGNDIIFTSELDNITIEPNLKVSFNDFTVPLNKPEALAYWENGVFEENELMARFSRPITRNVTASVYSNYRHYINKFFSHVGTDIYSLIQDLSPDSSKIVRNGYSPYINEYKASFSLLWKGENQDEYRFKVFYADLQNEVRDSGAAWISLNRYMGGIETYFKKTFLNKYYTTIYLAPLKNTIIFGPGRGTLGSFRRDHNESKLLGGVETGIKIFDDNTLGLRYTGNLTSFENTISEIDQWNYNKLSLFANSNFNVSGTNTILKLETFINSFSFQDSLILSPGFEAQCRLGIGNFSLRSDFSYDQILNVPQPESFLIQPQYVDPFDQYLQSGIELSYQSNRIGMIVGYRFFGGIEQYSTRLFWASATPPYESPTHVLLLSPRINLLKNLELKGKTFISDTKPYIKTEGGLTFEYNPKGTGEFISVSLLGTYWSDRDPSLTYATASSQDPIYDISLHSAVHVKSFRLFYKIDNILNRKIAYVPGYEDPGIIFRWGFNWFIQR